MASAMDEKLEEAAGAGRTAEVKQLIEKGVDVNIHYGWVCMNVAGGWYIRFPFNLFHMNWL